MTRSANHHPEPAARPVALQASHRQHWTSLGLVASLRALAFRLAAVLNGKALLLGPWRRHGTDAEHIAAADLAARLAAAQAALAEAEQRHRALLEALGVAVYTTDTEGRLTFYNEAAAVLWGWRPPLGDARWCGSWRLYHPDRTPLRHEACPMAVALGEGRPVRGVEAVAQRPDGSSVPFLPYPTPLRDERGALIGAVNVLVDITERKAAEERQVLLVREVDHRAKNALAVALSMVRLTRPEDPRRFAEAVEGRIAALANAHTLLAEEGWSGAELRAIAERELAAHLTGGRVVLHGPPVSLAPGAVQAVSMVLHELATNAAKYGALLVPGGRINVTWEVEGGDGLRLTWTERGGPRVAERPRYQGFGSKLIEATARSQLGGAVALCWEPEGLRCELTMSADRLLARHQATTAPGQGAATPDAAGAITAAPLAGRRILVAEDEALVALELEETLRDLGCEVIGPAATVEEALCLVLTEAGRLDAAVLDINLAGRPSFPVGDALVGRGVPVVCATGYGDLPEGQAVGRGRNVLLRKPLGPGELEAALLRMLAVAPPVGQGAAAMGKIDRPAITG